MKIDLISEKFFLSYSNMQLLKQQVNALNVLTIKNKLIIIVKISVSWRITQTQ